MKEGLYIDMYGRLIEIVFDLENYPYELEVSGAGNHVIFGTYLIYRQYE